jgi:hydrogenase-4 component B
VLTLVVVSIALLALSGTPVVLFRNRAGEWASTLVVMIASVFGLAGVTGALRSRLPFHGEVAWHLPEAELIVRLDAVAGAFLVPVFVLGAAAALYGLAYWPVRREASAVRVRVFSGLLLAGMAGVIIAAHGILFLVAWETMALSAFFLIAASDTDAEVRSAAWIYLVATHIGTLTLVALFVVMRSISGSFAFVPLESVGGLTGAIVFLLALGGFGFKAGLVPFHFWLPAAHASAPSHVSAILSGAMLKVGIYGLVRVLMLLPDPSAWWGGLLVVAGLVSAVLGITLALGQSDLKRALAYSSIENVGIIVTALGVATLGRATAHPALAAIGFAAAIAHVWNHSMFKGLLFFCAGGIVHATGTRRIDAMGGLLRRMPVTGGAFIVGALAASAIPGTNAFLSEAILYYGLLGEAESGRMAGLAVAVIALAGALAVACFVRLVGMILLGNARTAAADLAHEMAPSMRVPLLVLASICILTGLVPAVTALPLELVVDGAAGVVTPFLGLLTIPLQLSALAVFSLTVVMLAATRRSPRVPTWDCGYAAPSARMQYTSGSLSEWISQRLTPSFLRPHVSVRMPDAVFPGESRLTVRVDEPFADRVVQPIAERWARRAVRLRWVQQGRLHLYLLYILATLLAGIVWAIVFPLTGWLR